MICKKAIILCIVITSWNCNCAPDNERYPVPISINGSKSNKTVFVHRFLEEELACDHARVSAGLTWLPSSSVQCEDSSNISGHYDIVKLNVVKFVNVYEEKQISIGKNGREKVFELKKVSFKRNPIKGVETKVKGSLIWKELGLTDSDLLHTHEDPTKGKQISFYSAETFVIEKLDVLYVTRKSETVYVENKPTKAGRN